MTIQELQDKIQQMQEQLTEYKQSVAATQAALHELTSQVQKLSPIVEVPISGQHQAANPKIEKIAPGRRRFLRKLAFGMAGAVAVGATLERLTGTPVAEARIITSVGRNIGALVLPQSVTYTGTPPIPSASFGLVVSNTSIDLTSLAGLGAAIYATSNFLTIYATVPTGVAVQGDTVAGGIGVYGNAPGNSGGTGVLGSSDSGIGVVASSISNAQLSLNPKTTAGAPTTGSHAVGNMWMDSAGSLFVCVTAGIPGTWRQVMYI